MISELINRRRRQILFHSCAYYMLDTNIISDYQYDKLSKELVELQTKYPDIAAKCVYAKEFKTFTCGSGYDLPYHIYRLKVESYIRGG